MLLTVLGFILAGVVGICMWWVYGRILLLGQYRYRYTRLSPLVSPSGFSPPSKRGALRIVPTFIRRISSKLGDEENGRVVESYFELPSRRD